MDTLVIKFDYGLQEIFLDFDFYFIKKQIIKIMEKRYEVEKLMKKDNSIELAMNTIYDPNFSIEKAILISTLSESNFRKTVETVKIAITNKINFSYKYMFMLKEEDYLIWNISLDYEAIAIEETDKLIYSIEKKLSGTNPT